MPQLDFSTFAPQLVWLAITFAALYFIISKFALPKIGGTIEQRSSKIANDLDRAQAMKDDVDKAIVSYEAALADAKSKAHAIGQETRQKISAEIEAERARVDAQITDKVAEAEKKITATKNKAMGNVAKIASDLASSIVNDLTGTKVSASAASKAVGRASGE
jgi:F-type H+-transporting ATPase subunit b